MDYWKLLMRIWRMNDISVRCWITDKWSHGDWNTKKIQSRTNGVMRYEKTKQLANNRTIEQFKWYRLFFRRTKKQFDIMNAWKSCYIIQWLQLLQYHRKIASYSSRMKVLQLLLAFCLGAVSFGIKIFQENFGMICTLKNESHQSYKSNCW